MVSKQEGQMRLNSSHAAADQRREDTGTEDGEKDGRGFGTGRGFCSIYQDMFVCVLERFGPVVSQHWMASVIFGFSADKSATIHLLPGRRTLSRNFVPPDIMPVWSPHTWFGIKTLLEAA